jgi:hypothetical protein
VGRRTPGASFAFEGGAATIAFDVALPRLECSWKLSHCLI